MVRKNQLVTGLVLLGLGVLLFIGALAGVSAWRLLLPLILIGLGVWVLVWPRTLERDALVTQRIFGDIDRRGSWQVVDEEFMTLIGDVDLDLTQAVIPLGETRIRTAGFVQDVTLRVPEDVGVRVEASAAFGEVNLFGDKNDAFLSTVSVESGYRVADQSVLLVVEGFVAEVKVTRA